MLNGPNSIVRYGKVNISIKVCSTSESGGAMLFAFQKHSAIVLEFTSFHVYVKCFPVAFYLEKHSGVLYCRNL